ncbi:corticotropin-releasing factor receptor 2 [Galendromus occidentalis]|uniref:Corticotropin-releasing factor receptor 2 n=1 Tax=Galendromus occidentalis TaxID=34638 RepID=A0AAJ6VUY4_9ACAR|nr:corticotropin-releasing factor receptor 2 [Galendromus occidentalis]
MKTLTPTPNETVENIVPTTIDTLIASSLEFDERFSYMTKEECGIALDFWKQKGSLMTRWCPIVWDGISCWPPAQNGSTAAKSCNSIFHTFGPAIEEHPDALAYKSCGPGGTWLDSQTNYNACVALLNPSEAAPPSVAMTVTCILLIFSCVSLIFLTATAFIFTHFRSLHCSRTRVHLNLVVSLIINSIMLISLSMSIAINSGDEEDAGSLIRQTPWFCKTILLLKMYSSSSTINWMFVEGILLHSRITTSIFQTKPPPFKLYYFIGWGVPLIFCAPWAWEMEKEMGSSTCWEGYVDSPWLWLIIAPRLAAVTINFMFLVNIIRILVTRVKAVSAENTQFKKAIKATILLFPLLGLTHLLFCINPQEADVRLKNLYMLTNASLQSSQGIFVSVIYCFMNSEVQACIRNAYLRAVLRRNPNQRSLLRGGQSQTSVYLTHFSNNTKNNRQTRNQWKVIRKYPPDPPLRAEAANRIQASPSECDGYYQSQREVQL